MSVSEILNLSSALLEDIILQGGVKGVTWPQDTALLPYLNLANIEIVNLKPEAYASNVTIKLVSGTVQTVPTDALSLIDITNNLGISGGVPGRSIVKIERSILDRVLPYWNMVPNDTEVLHVICDKENPRIFYVYPPQGAAASQKIELIYESFPLTGSMKLSSGYEQSFPPSDIPNARTLLDVVRNISDGSSIGKISRKNLDSFVPNWVGFTPDILVSFVMIEQSTPNRFYVFPPQPVGSLQQWVEIIYNPDPVSEVVSLVSGPKQGLPVTAQKLIDPVRNMGTDGATPGRYITKIDKHEIDTVIPGWLDYMLRGEVQFYAIDQQNRKTFYVFPPQPSGTTQQVSAIVSKRPTEISTISQASPLDDSYIPLQVKRVVSLALMESTTIPYAINKAKELYAEFLAELQKETQEEGTLPSRAPSDVLEDIKLDKMAEQQKEIVKAQVQGKKEGV